MNQKYRKAVIAGNWKMNKLPSEVRSYIKQLRELLPPKRSLDVVICASYVNLSNLCKALPDAKILPGAQDVSAHDNGAYTGEVSVEMLADLGLRYCIVGHSERREYHNESDKEVNIKVKKLLDAGIIPIICVGESLEQREADITKEQLAYQIKAALSELNDREVRRCVIAYEPIWAIGTGKTASAETAGEMCKFIRTCIRNSFDARTARSVSILYGGSMNAKNSKDLLEQEDIDGGLIGGASLVLEDFVKIIESAIEVSNEKK